MQKIRSKKRLGESEKFWTKTATSYYDSYYKNVKSYPSLIVRHNYILDMFDQNGGRILDIGCGPGEMVIELLERGCDVHGIDISDGMIQLARKNVSEKVPNSQPKIRVGNVEDLNSGAGVYDGGICAGVIEYLPTDDKALRELNYALKKGGTLIVSVRNKICPARIFDLAIDRFKESKLGMALLNKLKKLTEGRSASEVVYTRYRKHYPWEIDRHLRQYGFEKEDFRFFHFYPFFSIFEKLLPSFYIKTGLWMERLSNSKLGWLGSGYIIKARKVDNIK